MGGQKLPHHVCLGVGITHLCILLIQQPYFIALFVLHSFFVKILIHTISTPTIILCNNRDCYEVFAIKHHIVITGFWFHLHNLLIMNSYRFHQNLRSCTLFFQLCKCCNQHIRVIQHFIYCVNTVSTNSRENFTCNPAFELFSSRQLAGKNMLVVKQALGIYPKQWFNT